MDGLPILHSISNLLIIAQSKAVETGAEAIEANGQTSQSSEAWGTYAYGAAFVLGIFVVPFVLSNFITKALRMPTHSFRFGLMLAAIFGGLLFASGNNFKLPLGADMKGGTNLVYDIMPDENGLRVDSGGLASALSDRINPSGTKEITIRPRGESQIEIVIPNTDPGEVDQIKKTLRTAGMLEFRIVANTRDHADIIELARQQAENVAVPKAMVKNAEGRVVGRWFSVGREEVRQEGILPLKTPVLGDIIRNSVTGQIITNPPLDLSEDYALEKWMDRTGVRDVEVLMAYETLGNPYAEVGGDDLSSAAAEFDKSGYVVSFRLNGLGARKMLRMTVANKPDGSFHRRMAIIMDGRVLSAPQLNSPISTNGQITGNFTKDEVEFLVTILRAGRLPAALSSEPASEARVGAGLGATTVQKGTNASIWAVVTTFVCILLYYRFAGVVASMALIINGLLIFGIMIFIGQPLTLPGLAGLVLTVGMSVDANVLIFERIREEKFKGSAPRMAIRNGFDRAFTTIIDANITTLIAAIVLYWIGTDQVRGFAVALVIGIMTSMFTATFCSRIAFEFAEKLKLVSLSMSDGVGFLKRSFLGDGELNFMRWQGACFAMSVVLILAGLTAVFIRGRDILNIDFTGGTSVTFQLDKAVDADDLRQFIKKILPEDENGKPLQFTLVRVEKEPADTVYSMVCSIADEKYLSESMANGFATEGDAKLKTYQVNILGDSAQETGGLQRIRTRFVSFQQDPQEEAATNTTDPSPPIAAENSNSVGPASTDAEGATAAGADRENGLAVAVPATVESELLLEFVGSTDGNPNIDPSEKGAGLIGNSLLERLGSAAETAGVSLNRAAMEVYPEPLPQDWRPDAISGHSKWRVKMPVAETDADTVVNQLQVDMAKEPLWLSLSKIGSRVAGEMQQRAIAAILLSLVFIVAYIWFRFQKMAYGLAAVVALVHDVLITLGVLALCHWLAGPLKFLLIEDFKVGLTEVAAFLTIIGYSLNDTIVVFDRIREVRGRSPMLTAKMINESVNQTLSRTLLTSGTTLLTVILLYVFGGEGIHTFAFALMIGVLVGTYSSIFVAAPVLLWITKRGAANQHRPSTAG